MGSHDERPPNSTPASSTRETHQPFIFVQKSSYARLQGELLAALDLRMLPVCTGACLLYTSDAADDM
eukprot:1576697-Prymnesium_polylepis.1